MKKPFLERIAGREIQAFVVFTIALFWLAAFLTDTPIRILEGMVKIVSSRDALITDYFELGGYGAAFFNGGLVLLMALFPALLGLRRGLLFVSEACRSLVQLDGLLFAGYLSAVCHRHRLGRYPVSDSAIHLRLHAPRYDQPGNNSGDDRVAGVDDLVFP